MPTTSAHRHAPRHYPPRSRATGRDRSPSSPTAGTSNRSVWSRTCYTATQVAAAAFLTDLVAATLARRDTIVHGDYSPKNVLVRSDRLILLDHEVIHFGDPGFDLGFSPNTTCSARPYLPTKRADFAAAAIACWTRYRDTLGDVPFAADLEPRAVRHTLGCLLARVRGRSPLEYLDADERTRQAGVVVRLIADPPRRSPRHRALRCSPGDLSDARHFAA